MLTSPGGSPDMVSWLSETVSAHGDRTGMICWYRTGLLSWYFFFFLIETVTVLLTAVFDFSPRPQQCRGAPTVLSGKTSTASLCVGGLTVQAWP